MKILVLAVATLGALAIHDSAQAVMTSNANIRLTTVQDKLPSDKDIRKAWGFLKPDEQREITAWFTAEASYLETTQNQLIKYLMDSSEVDRGFYEAPAEVIYYNPAIHSPAQPIKRTWLDADSSSAKAALKKFVPVADTLMRAYVYDWTSGDVVCVADEEDVELVFENAMMGFPPLADLAEALLLQRLDDGSQREGLTAFAHAYTDRTGNVFPGITLYDAWASGADMEMPDVDVLGIVHEVLDEWKKWKAPIPGGQQNQIYTAVGEIFLPAMHHRALRQALAANYLRGKGVPNDGYAPQMIALNALWEDVNGEPEAMVKQLPKSTAKAIEKYTKSLTRKIKKKKFRESGMNRLAWFEAERYRVKATLVWVLREFGAFDRKKLPE